ncbi:MAG TPA: endopeptidase La, partial [Saprospirales bacterium]|nr:endopeptidase La [Saprospirales bacterium]
SVKDTAKEIIKLSPNLPNEAELMLDNISSNGFLLNFIASNLNINVDKKQGILEMNDAQKKAKAILHLMETERKKLKLKHKIESKVRGDLEKQQRDYILNQQLKTIQEELGDNPQSEALNELTLRAEKMDWPSETAKTFNKELAKAKRMNPQVAEFSVTLNYLEMLLDLPWNMYSKDNYDLKKVRKILDDDHFGMEKIKERIIEHLAVLKLKGDMKSPIICLVGPPGVGKTSLGKSIASALNRKFVRMSLGGLHDESEIRGHRRTYIGAMPGRLIKSLKKAETSNPVFILDEIDKLGRSQRGDPSSALLEVLDSEQNTNFYDNYLELEYDLSKVLFIATANTLSTIQAPLRDRMEIIQLSGYSTEEKVQIAKKHLVPRQRKENGLLAKDIKLSEKVLEQIVLKYSRESGVRALERQIAKVMRRYAKHKSMEEPYDVSVKVDDLVDILGHSPFHKDMYVADSIPGVVVGLAWTQVGGEILFIEASKSPGKGKLTLTGSLGDVMKESATTALSYLKSHAEEIGIDRKILDKSDIHIHVPEGATPKDGPSAGITMLTALTSILLDKPVKSHLAMTGEITLRGKVLPVGGIKEKILAAKRAGIKQIMMSEVNRKHVEDIPKDYLVGIEFTFVKHMSEVLKEALDV